MPSENPSKRVADIQAAINRIRSYTADIGGLDALLKDEYLHRDGVERQMLIVAEDEVIRGILTEDLDPLYDAGSRLAASWI